jgi:REP element-mobilizing transposase RayT
VIAGRKFLDDVDRKTFLETLGATCQRTGWQVHAYCLMTNHFHLVVETPRANLVEGMKWLLGTYAMRFNRRHKLSGPFVRRALQVALDRWNHAGEFAHGMRLCAFESGAGQVTGNPGAIAKAPLEQFPELFEKQAKTRAMAALRIALFAEHGLVKGVGDKIQFGLLFLSDRRDSKRQELLKKSV